jgi:hypothetical protein
MRRLLTVAGMLENIRRSSSTTAALGRIGGIGVIVVLAAGALCTPAAAKPTAPSFSNVPLLRPEGAPSPPLPLEGTGQWRSPH